MEFNYFDVAVIGITILFAVIGLFKGLVKEFFGLIWQVGGIYLGNKFAERVGIFISENIISIDDSNRLIVIGFFIVFFTFTIIIILLRTIILKFISLIKLGFLDKILGMVFGGGKIILIVSILVYGISSVDLIKEIVKEKFSKSVTYPYLLSSGSILINSKDGKVIAKKIKENISERTKSAKKIVEEKFKKSKDMNFSNMDVDIEDLEKQLKDKIEKL